MIPTAQSTDFSALALRGLAALWGGGTASLMPFTVRGLAGGQGPHVAPEGASLRYTAIVALGLSRQPSDVQRQVLGGRDAEWLAHACHMAATGSRDTGAVALSLWAAGEVARRSDDDLVERLTDAVRRGPVSTVDGAWILLAALASPAPAAPALADTAAGMLMAAQSQQGLLPHALPQAEGLRGHVACFADQVYPILALARYAGRRGDARALASADAAAQRIVDLQGAAGQWWWHYDVRTGDVVERYPVYSVHQHGMAPMALSDLAAAGGADHSGALRRGIDWLTTHPECIEPLVVPELGVVWRKVGRREPRKAARRVAALHSRVRPHTPVPGVDRLWPPGKVDYECRPYELGWLLYAAGLPGRGARHE